MLPVPSSGRAGRRGPPGGGILPRGRGPTVKLLSHDDTISPATRAALLVVAALFSGLAWRLAAGGTFTLAGVTAWALSVLVLHSAVVAGAPREPGAPSSRLLLAGLALAVLLAALFRFGPGDAAPPEMTSDHVEKLLDVLRIEEGARPVFCYSNGGRESLHFYFLVLLRAFSGLPLSFPLLKLGSVLEGLLSVLATACLARELVRGVAKDAWIADAAAVAAASLLAIGHWHVLLSRLGLRLVLAPLFFAVVSIPLARGVRTGSRRAFASCGLLLGLSLYGYQANRVLPLLVVTAILAALAVRRESPRAKELLSGLVTTTALSAAVAVPLLRYAADSPAFFWERMTGRILGDGPGAGSWSGQLSALTSKSGVLLDNLGRTLAMLHHRTDASWFCGVPTGAPALDPLTGLLLVAGLAAFLVTGWRRSDPAFLLPLLGLGIGLFPSVLAISHPGEVPHAARSGGALPFAAALAGYAVALLLSTGLRGPGNGRRRIASILVLLLAFSGAAAWNADVYFRRAMEAYRAAAQPHRAAGAAVREFVRRTGARGNVFILPFPNWLDHRAVVLEAEGTDFDIVPERADDQAFADLAARKATTKNPFAPRLDSLFLVHPSDREGATWLRRRFREGRFEDLSLRTGRPLCVFETPPSE